MREGMKQGLAALLTCFRITVTVVLLSSMSLLSMTAARNRGGTLAFSILPPAVSSSNTLLSRGQSSFPRLFVSSSASRIDPKREKYKQQQQQQQQQQQRLFPEELNILYDSKCNVCQWEINFLRQRDLSKNQAKPRLRFTDLEGLDYNATDPANGGITYAIGMASMRGVLPTGQVLTGVPVFRMAYDQVGLGWLFVITTWPVFRQLADLGYRIFAKYRTRLTRGGKSVPELVAIYEEQQKAMNAARNSECEGNSSCPKRY